ncbi:MAG: hypothetical protein IKX71_04770 [Bacteroidales bacterium]|nr:hypothetical protein [Bacteroidales bacterium]
MKKLISLAACIMAVVLVAVSCTPKDKPDGKCELTAFSLKLSVGVLSTDIAGTIDNSAKTITVVIPTSVTKNTFKPTFTATEWDVVTIGGTPVTSGETEVTIADGTKVVVSDDVSALKTEYTIVVKANDQKAELVAVSFKAADNSLLENDVTPDAIASEMVVRVPGTAFRQELTVTVQAGFNDEIKVNNTAVESGSSIKVDTSFPIDITVNDAVAGTTATYVLKVGKILEYVVSQLGSYAEGSMIDFNMTISPADNSPYFAYVRKIEGDSNNGISVAKWNGSSFALVGNTAVADASARSASKPQVTFAKDGTLYLYYLGGDVASKPTVKKFDSEWNLVGTAGITPQNCNTTYHNSFFVHPGNSQPAFLWSGNSKNTPSLRKMNYSYFSGSDWTSIIESSGVPEYTSGTANAYYTSAYVIVNDKVFIVSTFNGNGYYIHGIGADGTMTTVVENYVPDSAPYALPTNIQLKKGTDGTIYMMGAVNAGDNSMQIFSVDQDAHTLKTYGAGLPVTIGSGGSISQGFGFDINPLDGLFVSAYADTENAAVLSYLDDNLQWSNFDVEAPAVSNKSPVYVAFNSQGDCFVSYLSANGIELFRVGLEEDILPE